MEGHLWIASAVVCLLFSIFVSISRKLIVHNICSGGLYPGDIITHINGKEIRGSSDVYEALSHRGKALNINIYRGLSRHSLTVIPEDPQEDDEP